MTADTEGGAAAEQARATGRFRPFGGLTVSVRRFLGHHIFSSLTRRILFLNLAALIVLVTGILYLNQFRDGLTDARV